MHFQLIFNNQAFGLYCEDHFLLIQHLLESIGHSADCDHIFGSHNIILENFNAQQVSLIRGICSQGADVIVVATEFITGRTFNDMADGAISGQEDPGHYAKRPYWKERYDHFLCVAEVSRAIWLTTDHPEQIAAYRAIVPSHVPVIPLPYVHCPSFPRVTPRSVQDVDVLLTGTETPYRMSIVQSLMNQGLRIVYSPYLPEYIRRPYLARSKLCVNIRQSPGWRYPSLMRYWYHLNHGQRVVTERCPVPCSLDPYVLAVHPAELAAFIKEYTASGRWAADAIEAYERFVAERPCRPAAERLLDLTFSR